jgi:ketosteroid isomerase-like protein
VLKDPAFKLTFAADKVDVSASGDLAVTTGTYKATFTDPATKKITHEEGGYVTAYKEQDDGSWKAVSDINAAAAPAPAATAAPAKAD